MWYYGLIEARISVTEKDLPVNITKYFFQPLDPNNEEDLISSKSEKFKNSFVVRTKSSKKAQYFPLFDPKEEKYIFGEIEDDNDIPIPEIGITEEFGDSKNFTIEMQKGHSVPERLRCEMSGFCLLLFCQTKRI